MNAQQSLVSTEAPFIPERGQTLSTKHSTGLGAADARSSKAAEASALLQLLAQRLTQLDHQRREALVHRVILEFMRIFLVCKQQQRPSSGQACHDLHVLPRRRKLVRRYAQS